MATIYVGSARIDERGKYSGGTVGDQKQTSSTNDTVGEVSMQKMYAHSKGWYIFRPKDVSVSNAIASAMITACNNKNLGYDQSNRLGVIKYGVDTTTKTECDCSALVRACIIKATGKDVGNFTTATETTYLANSGLFENKITYVNQSATPVYNGDILVTKTKGHTVIVVSGNPRGATIVSASVPQSTSNSGNQIIALGQAHANNFAQCGLVTDGIRGANTRKAAVKVVQRALNADYNAGLIEDGIWGNATERAFGKHYVTVGETQYLVTALEILCMLKGIDPNGVECPGKFGNGLVNACGTTKAYKDTFKNLTT